MYCANCGNLLELEDLFCANCGTKIDRSDIKEVNSCDRGALASLASDTGKFVPTSSNTVQLPLQTSNRWYSDYRLIGIVVAMVLGGAAILIFTFPGESKSSTPDLAHVATPTAPHFGISERQTDIETIEPEKQADIETTEPDEQENLDKYLVDGLTQYHSGEFLEAKESFLTHLSLHPNDPRAHVALGDLALFEDRKYNEATTLYEKGINFGVERQDEADVYGKLGHSYHNLGDCHRFMNRPPKANIESCKDAIDSYRKASELDPDNQWHFFYLGQSYKHEGSYLLAAENLEQSIEIRISDDKWINERDEEMSGLYTDLGLIYTELESFQLAIEYFGKALAVPENENTAAAIVGLERATRLQRISD